MKRRDYTVEIGLIVAFVCGVWLLIGPVGGP